jgi:chromosome segregation ATPase
MEEQLREEMKCGAALQQELDEAKAANDDGPAAEGKMLQSRSSAGPGRADWTFANSCRGWLSELSCILTDRWTCSLAETRLQTMELIDAVETRKLVFDEFSSTFEKQLLALNQVLAIGAEELKRTSTNSKLEAQSASERDHASRQAMHAHRVIMQTLHSVARTSQLGPSRPAPGVLVDTEPSSARALAESVAVDQLSKMLETERAKARRLEDRLVEAQRPCAMELVGTGHASTAELVQQRGLVRQLQDELASLRVQRSRVDEVELQLQNAQSQNIDLQAMRESAEREAEQLRAENGTLRAQVHELQSAAASSLAECAAKQQSVEANISEISRLHSVIDELHTQLAEGERLVDGRVDDTNKEVMELSSELLDARRKIEDLQSSSANLQAVHKAIATEAQLLRKENDALITDVRDAHAYTEEIFALKEEVAIEAQRVLRENDDLKQKLRSLEAATTTSREESLAAAERVRFENDDLKKLLQTACSENGELVRIRQHTAADMEQLRSEIDRLKVADQSAAAANQGLASENYLLREQLHRTQSANAELSSSTEEARAEIGRLRSESELLAQQMRTMQTDSAQALGAREDTAAAAQEVVRELRLELRRLHAENKELLSFREECELSMQHANAEALADANALRQELARVTRDLETKTAELDDLQQRLSECETGLAESLSREAAAVRLAAIRAEFINSIEDEARQRKQATSPGLSAALCRGTASDDLSEGTERFERSGAGEILGTLNQVRSQLESSLIDLCSMNLINESRVEPEALDRDQLTMLRELMHNSRCSTREATTIAAEAAIASKEAATALQEAREANEVLRREVTTRRLEAAAAENECEHLRARLQHTLDELSLVQAHAQAAYEMVPPLKQELEQTWCDLADAVASRDDCKVSSRHVSRFLLLRLSRSGPTGTT